jgi:hypothetical protein
MTVGFIIANDGDKIVNAIADRNALNKKFDGMEVTVIDSIADTLTGGGRACYKWLKTPAVWQLVWKDNKDNLFFTHETKTIVNGKVTAEYLPQSGIVFEAYVLDSAGDSLFLVSSPNVIGKDIDIGSVDYNGFTLTYKYAYGLSSVHGLKGDKGDTGLQGIQGVAGNDGAKGDKGDTGLQGIQGVAGTDGAKGDKGDTGLQGIQGVAGTDGAKGDKGDKGDAGTPFDSSVVYTKTEVDAITGDIATALTTILGA